MGGALASAIAGRGEPAHLIHLTRGERGHPTLPAERFAEQLDEEMNRASRALNVPFRWAGLRAPLSDARLGEACEAVQDLLVELRPAAVLTHWVGSWHPSHVQAHIAVRDAVTARRENGQPIDLLYGENCEDLLGFNPTGFADVSSVQDDWRQALRAYDLYRRSESDAGSDSPVPYSSYYEAAMKVRGLQAGMERAQTVMAGSGPMSSQTREWFTWLDLPETG
ncbi:MAG: PIG-L family deacetylase [Candidatus Dormibacteraeota bacterium]|nr:PIG-L family deacetylase [Candidatus Dormibacteraeota bacterium]